MDEQSRNVKDLQQNRERVIVRTGIVGITVNLLLVAFKAGVGLLFLFFPGKRPGTGKSGGIAP